MSFAMLKEELKSGNFKNLYVFYGAEGFLRKYYLDALIKKCIDDSFRDFNLNIFDAKELDVDEFLMSLESYPMMSERKVIILRNPTMQLFNGRSKEAIADGFATILENNICVITYDDDVDLEKDQKNATLLKKLKSFSFTLVNFEPPKEVDLVRWVARHFSAQGKSIDSRDISYMLSICDNKMESLQNEINKICRYVVVPQVTRREIDKLVIKSVQGSIYDLRDSLAKGDYDTSLVILDSLYKQKVEGVVIIGGLASAFLAVSRAKAMMEGKARDEEIMEVCAIRWQSHLNTTKSLARKMDKDILSFILLGLSKADIELKSSKMNDKTILELFIVSVLSFEREKKR